MYKAIFIDIDGTLRNSKRQLTDKTREIVKKVTEKGILVILCSGRPRKHAENVSRQANASKYIITSNGSGIYDYEDNKTISINCMDKQECIELYKIAESISAKIMMNGESGRVVNRITDFDGTEKQLDQTIEEYVENNNIEQCVITDRDFQKIKKIKPLIEKLKKVEIKNQHKSLTDETTPKEGNIYYDIADIQSNKGNAIIKLCKLLNIDLKDTVAIGDEYNDLSMFQIVGYSVAMGNANEKIKAQVNEVTLSNDEDGVAVFLEKLLHEEK